eukprot:CCRYP_016684-RA/>CCRYP_016684-RA protein AED:0.10 eAED:0.14 QI:0/0/0/1/0.25/0/5/0/1241
MPRKKRGPTSVSESAHTLPTENLSFCSGSTSSSMGSFNSDETWGYGYEFDLEDVHDDVTSAKPIASGIGTPDDMSVASNATVKTSIPSREMLKAVDDASIGKKAARADDAKVPVYLWNMRICGFESEEERDKAANGFWLFGQSLFSSGLRRDCAYSLEQKYGLEADGSPRWMSMPRHKDGRLTELGWELQGIQNMMWHALETNLFKYICGSKTYHFRFPICYHSLARDGCKIYFERPGPTTKQTQPEFSDPNVRSKVKEKIMKVVKRKYMMGTTIPLSSLIKYFAVPKGDNDIQIVYDATASGLNECVWAPSFWLPTVDLLLRALDADLWMADRDIGEMFLNFELHRSAWPFTGVDLQPLADDEGNVSFVRWYHWVRNLMGFKPSPYGSEKTTLVAEEVVRDDRHDPKNPYQWDQVDLNLPGPGFVPTKAWISKIRKDELVACDLFTFVDDEWIAGSTEELTWQASHTLGSEQAYLGIQDAARKVGQCSQTPRACAGAVVHVVPKKGVCVLTSEDKWQKLKSIISTWLAKVKAGEEYLDHKDLLSDCGFLVYVTRAYPGMIPYLKGFHLTIEMWRGNQDAEGWKLPSKDLANKLTMDQQLGPIDDEEAKLAYLMRKKVESSVRAPVSGKTPPAPRLFTDLQALEALTEAEMPPLWVVRPAQVVQVLYGFGDASGTGLGSTVQGLKINALGEPEVKDGLRYRVGVWGKDEELESSNYRELANLVMTVEDEAVTALWTIQNFSYLPTTRLRRVLSTNALLPPCSGFEASPAQAETRSHFACYPCFWEAHDCSRDRRLLPWCAMEGAMAGDDMLSFVDLAKSAFDRSPRLLDWIQSWSLNAQIQPLTPEGWFELGHGIIGGKKDRRGVWIPEHEPSGQTHLWAPPPAAADAALKELLKARHKRTDTFHIVVIPCLFSPRWRRLFHKVVDVNFTVPPGCNFWPTNMFEPLWWTWEGTCTACALKVEPLQGIFCANFASSRGGWPSCRQVWHGQCYECLGQGMFPLAILNDNDNKEWEKQKIRESRLNIGCDGAHTVIPFQCEVCWVRNLTGREMSLPRDKKLRNCIQRANLDALSGRAKSTIESHLQGVKTTLELSEELGKPPSISLTPRGPMPLEDVVGMSLAIEMLYKSHLFLLLGLAPLGIKEGSSFSKGIAKWFTNFLLGAQDQMGYDTKNQLALSIKCIITLLDMIKSDATERDELYARRLLTRLVHSLHFLQQPASTAMRAFLLTCLQPGIMSIRVALD